jgi:hypothetical protein
LNGQLLASLNAPRRPVPQPTKQEPRQKAIEPERARSGGYTVARAKAVLRRAAGGYWQKGWSQGAEQAHKSGTLDAWVTRCVQEAMTWQTRAATFAAEAREAMAGGDGWYRWDPDVGAYRRMSEADQAQLGKDSSCKAGQTRIADAGWKPTVTYRGGAIVDEDGTTYKERNAKPRKGIVRRTPVATDETRSNGPRPVEEDES